MPNAILVLGDDVEFRRRCSAVDTGSNCRLPGEDSNELTGTPDADRHSKDSVLDSFPVAVYCKIPGLVWFVEPAVHAGKNGLYLGSFPGGPI